MATGPTISELVKQGAILAADVHEAADAFLTDPTMTVAALTAGYVINVAAAVRRDRLARAILRSPTTAWPARQAAVRTAILLARPEKQ